MTNLLTPDAARRPTTKPRSATGPLLSLVVVALVIYGGWTNGGFGTGDPPPAGHAGPVATLAPTAPDPPPEPEPGADLVRAADVLATLAVKGRAPKTGYGRLEQFGRAWLDVDDNSCDTRNDILARDLLDITVDARCRVLTGTLHDPYTDRTIDFVRGPDTSARVQIDHVVSLSDAWQKGAQQWSQEERIAFANDPLNLLAVDGPANQQKSDSDAASWLPKNKAYRCEFVARQISVKAAHGLWVTAAEKGQMARVLATCPDQPALASKSAAA